MNSDLQNNSRSHDLNITFKNYKNDEIVFSWKMIAGPTEVRWMELMKRWKSQWGNGRPEWDDKWFLASTQEDYLNLIKQIRSLVEMVDNLGATHLGTDLINENIDQSELNRLHQAFHSYVERPNKNLQNPAERETEKLCHQLNHLIHLTEGAEYNRNAQHPSFKIIATARQHMHVDYHEIDYYNTKTTSLAGWIYAGYATPGKNLYHCFADNDLSVVTEKMVRQSQGLSNELHIELTGNKVIDQIDENEVKRKYYEWCRQNKVNEYGYNFYEPTYYPGRIPLAYPKENPSTLISFFGGHKGEIIDFEFVWKL